VSVNFSFIFFLFLVINFNPFFINSSKIFFPIYPLSPNARPFNEDNNDFASVQSCTLPFVILNAISSPRLFIIKCIFKPKNQPTDVLPYSNEDLLKYSEPVFLEERRPLAQYKEGDLLMFSTFETTHVQDIYNKKALDTLIEEYGLHIGHTYILNDLPYLSGIFTKEKGQLRLSNKWIKFTEDLSKYVQEEKIWNPNMGEFIQRLKSIANIEFRWISTRNFFIQNKNNYNVPDFTFIIPTTFNISTIICDDQPLKTFSTDSNFHFFTLHLNALQSYSIRL